MTFYFDEEQEQEILESRAKEFHLHPLAERSMNLSTHSAPIIQPFEIIIVQ